MARPKNIGPTTLALLFDEPVPFEGLRPALTPAQEVFAQEVATGRTQTQAFIRAFPDCSHLGGNPSKMANRPMVAARIHAIKTDIAAMLLWDRVQSIEALKGVVHANAGSPAIVPAVRELNAMHGFGEVARVEVGAPGAFDVKVRIVDHGDA